MAKSSKLSYKHFLRALDMLTQGADAPVPQSFRAEALQAKESASSWMMGAGTQGVGIGAMEKDGQMLKDLAIKVYVKKKLPKSKIKGEMAPKQVEMAGVPEPAPTDVVEIGQMELEMNTGRVRPAIPGYSVSHVQSTAGTFGCVVQKRGNAKTYYMLSNSHVLALSGVADRDDQIVQPGPLDGGTTPDGLIGKLTEWVPFQFDESGFANRVDAAIARVKKSDVTSAINVIGVPKGVSSRLRRGMRVQKSGRTTGHTFGYIRDINYRFAMQYDKPGGGKGRVGFADQVLCSRYTAGGDSGSAVCNSSGKVVGLHFAGSPSSSVFSPIQFVLDALDIELVTSSI